MQECEHEWEYLIIVPYTPNGVWVCEKCGLEKKVWDGETTYTARKDK